jgi:hypothetical protein
MKNLFIFFCLSFFLFACTIEKRLYFDGYHVENGRMGKWENGEMARSTGLGTGEEGKRGSGDIVRAHGPQKGQGGSIVIAEKKSDSQNLIVAFDNCLIAPEVELVMPNLDMIAPPTPARVSERLDSLNTSVNWQQIIQEQRREAEYNFLFAKVTNAKRNPLAKFDIVKFFLTGISALLLGGLLIGLSGNSESFFKGFLPIGIVIAIIGLVMIIISAIRVGRAEVGDPRVNTHKKSIGLFNRRF